MKSSRGSAEKSEELVALYRREIKPKEGGREGQWWIFPCQGPIMGFFGVRPLIVIGDQPSTSDWPEWHRSRRLFYEALIELGVPDAHLTDVIKRRGKSSESRETLPADFSLHLDLLQREIEIIQPSRIVALGDCAENLLQHLPDPWRKMVRRAWHFAYGTRPGKAAGFVARLRAAIYDESGNDAVPPRDFSEEQRVRQRTGNGARRLHSYTRVRASGTLSLIRDPCPSYQPRADRGAALWKLARDFAAAGTTFEAATNRTGLPKDYLQYFIEKGGIAVDGLTGEAAYANCCER